MLGMADVTFEEYSVKVKGAISDTTEAVLHEVAGEVIAAVGRNYDNARRVDTGKTKGSWRYGVKRSKDSIEAVIGSDMMNAIWEEFGTGEYALNGDGRKGGWRYQDEEGNWHATRGKTPSRVFFKAYTALKDGIIRRLQAALRGL